MFGIFLLTVTLVGRAQSVLPEFFSDLQTDAGLPQTLQSTRSAVFLKIDPSEGIDSAAYYAMAKEFHKGLAALNIDAVAYYRWQDLNAGFDATASYLEDLADREIDQIIILEVQQGTYHVYIVPTDHEKGLMDTSEAWHISGNTLESTILAMTRNVQQAGLEVSNFLILESPEFFIDTPIFKKNRFESFQPDLKLDKLAVPLFHSADPGNIQNSDDQELQTLMELQYPFEYELVGNTMSEDLMRKAGFHYVLRYLYAEESTLLTLLDYQPTPDDPSRFGYKYYFKHLVTGDIYLGENWDSRPGWQEALTLHLSNMRRSLGVE